MTMEVIMKKILDLILVLLLVMSFTNCTAKKQNPSTSSSDSTISSLDSLHRGYRVVRVIDGDTIVVLINGVETKVRLIGVDTPETVHPQKPVEAFGIEASNFLKGILYNAYVDLAYDDSNIATNHLDKYGRTLAYVIRTSDNLVINEEIIKQGYGHAYVKYPFARMESYVALEKQARESNAGLWGSSSSSNYQQNSQSAISTQPKQQEPTRYVEKNNTQPERQNTNDYVVYITRTGAKYHRAGCRYLSKSCIETTKNSAVSRGYGACKVCNP